MNHLRSFFQITPVKRDSFDARKERIQRFVVVWPRKEYDGGWFENLYFCSKYFPRCLSNLLNFLAATVLNDAPSVQGHSE